MHGTINELSDLRSQEMLEFAPRPTPQRTSIRATNGPTFFIVSLAEVSCLSSTVFIIKLPINFGIGSVTIFNFII